MNIRDFIENRRSEVKAQIKALKAELIELGLAEAALKTGVLIPSPSTSAVMQVPTIKEMVLEVLKSSLKGAESTVIAVMIENQFGQKIERSSLSPQLSRLKSEGKIDFDGKLWVLNRENSDSAASTVEPEYETGGDEVQGQDFRPESPEGAIPSTSTPIGQNTTDWDLDDEIPF